MDNVQLGRGTDGIDRPAARPGAMRRLGLPAVALSVALGAAQVAAAMPSQAAQSGSVAVGHAPALPKGAVSATAPSATKKLSLNIELNTGHAAELSAYAAAVGNQSSPYYHQYLTPSQVATYFGASSTEVAAVESALKAQGLTVDSLSSDGMFLTVSGTVAQAEHAFGVKIAGYRAAGRSFYANTTAPTIPAAVASDVSGILGLDSVDYAVPHVSTSHAVKPAGKVASKVTSNYTNNSCSDIASVYSGSYSDGAGYYTANSISSIYGLDKVLAAGNDGAGVTVGVFELESYDPQGVAAINSCYGHSSTSVSEVAVDGGPTAAANMYTGVGIESALDIENIANLAPGVSIVDYAGPDAADATDAQVLDVFNTMITADKAKVISDSWGLCEVLTKSDSTMQSSENTLFQEAATQGQTVLVASGDSGSTDCYGAGVTADNSVLSVDDPSSQQYVTAVGGTGMTGLTNPKPYTWNECETYQGQEYCGASGGGVSNTWSLPSWQSGALASGYSSQCTSTVSQGGTGCRQVPDVSALADSNDGYVIEEYYNDGTAADTGIYYNIVGGTSGAAPVWAAVIALADASATCAVGGPAGFVNPALYTVGKLSSTAVSAFATDVTTGNNKIADYGATFGYSATTGYDMATGWGTPLAAGVVATVCQAPSYYQQDGPTRVLDTRKSSEIGGTVGPIAKNGTVTLQVAGNNYVPSNATAVVLNVTVTSTVGAGNATVYPHGENLPLVSNLNWVTGNTVANLVVVPLVDGKVNFWNGSTGTVQFIADLQGYYTTATSVSSVASSSYTPVGPIRAMDTRSGQGVAQAKLAAQTSVELQLGGATITSGSTSVTLPAGITGIAMNVTATNVTGSGYLAVYPDENSSGGSIATPNVSNLNYAPGMTVPNMTTIPVGKDGKVAFFNGAKTGSVDVLADIAGYYTSGTSGDAYHPLGPVRLVDTRKGEGETSAAPIPSKGTLNLALPSSYAAVITNLTVTQPQLGGYLNAYPLGGTTPNVSNVNFGKGQTIPNLAIVPSNSGVTFYNNASGTVQLVVDLAGYFSAN